MKYFSTILFFSLFCTAVTAQNAQVKREVGLQFSGLNFNGNNSFSAFYKKQVKENSFRRIRFLAGNLNIDGSKDRTFGSFFAGVSIGREKRKQLGRKLQFYRGPQFGASTTISASSGPNSDHQVRLGLNAGLVFGLQHQFNEFWAVNIETEPGVGLDLAKRKGAPFNVFGAANVGNNVQIGLVRCF